MERREKTALEVDTAPMGLSIGALECVSSHAYVYSLLIMCVSRLRVPTMAALPLFFLMGKKGPKSPIAKALKGNRNASKQRSESRGAEDVARGDQRGTSTSAATSVSHKAPRKRFPDIYKDRAMILKGLKRTHGDAAGPSVRLTIDELM